MGTVQSHSEANYLSPIQSHALYSHVEQRYLDPLGTGLDGAGLLIEKGVQS